MPAASQVIALLSSHLEGNEERVRTVALQIAATEARQGHTKTAAALRRLLDAAAPKDSRSPNTAPTLLAKPRGELEGLVTIADSSARLNSMIMTGPVRDRLDRLVRQQTARGQLREHAVLSYGLNKLL